MKCAAHLMARNARVHELRRKGMRVRDIARALNMIESNVQYVLGCHEDPAALPVALRLTRACLMCRKEFEAERGIFVCMICKRSEAWSNGVA